MDKRIKAIQELKALAKAMSENQCYACSHEFEDLAKEFGTNIVDNAISLLEAEEASEKFRAENCAEKQAKALEGLSKCELYGQTLQYCLEQECPYVDQRGKTGECVHFLHEDAVAVLRETVAADSCRYDAPRMLTLEEAASGVECYVEFKLRYYNDGYGAYYNASMDEEDFLFSMVGCVYLRTHKDEYAKSWRCWDRKPTDEQSKAVPWDE